ncbi:MAG: NAD(P)/FAD-dependent oxidoreductase [Bacteroidales bacterium]|jgi:phytoene dehydrogenase-like protein|nr:NAD(P)/FAD-dependent oxidoreductase [Bacteroidales bacterium]
MKQQKKVIIIGAGLAGMSAGSYLQMNGFNTEIFESYSMSGGLCASWKRKDYNIDGCIHFMEGLAPDEVYYDFWNNIIDMKSIDFVFFDSHSVVDDKDGKRIHFYSNIDRLEKEFLTKAPEDAKQIKKFIGLVRKFNKVQLPIKKPFEVMTVTDKLKVAYHMFPYLRSMQKYLKITNRQFAEKLKNPTLKYAIETAFVGHMPLFYSIMPLVWRNKKDTGYPKGGAALISGMMQESYQKLGGLMHFDSKVKKIQVENDHACGIELENGEVHQADIVINAADGRTAIYDLLGGKYKDKNIFERYETDVFETIDKTLYIALGINRDFSDMPRKIHFHIDKPIVVDRMTTMTHLEVTHYCDDPHAAPKGKSLLALMPEAKDWEYWQNLRLNNKSQYNKEKIRVAKDVIEALENKFGNIKDHVEMIDVATPATYIRYTNNWTGGQISWKATRKTFGKPTTWQIKGLKDFYMTGQWAGTSGGLINVVMMGNHLTQIICKNESRKFTNKAQKK